ncbi:polysaccharide biosynthesis tyrosine autokinase [Arthrobacter cupressi]|uniref:polysaccharide biosynthesis tyrosine autokinase n=1 Tax=Arthrobacter cupressi TaxID=1045773 RepID=UPI000A011E94|nr:polysaccharide biosynthesis tyrosine autokinase [Arthrobacter cupressi]
MVQQTRQTGPGQRAEQPRTPSGGGSLELSEYLRAIVRGWWIVLVCAVAGLGAAAIVTENMQPQYQSTVRFLVVSPPATGQSALQSDELSRGRIATYAALVKNDLFVERILRDSGVPVDGAQALDAISASGDRDTLLLTVVVTMPDASDAVAAASAIAKNFGPAVNELEEGRRPEGSSQTVLTVVSGPTPEDAPVAPRVGLNLGLGLLLGVALGIGIAVGRRLMDHSLRTPEQVEAATGLPLLARIPHASAARSFEKLLQRRSDSLVDEAGRRLRTNVDHLSQSQHLHSVTVTSATAGEGKTTAALLLAKAWAESGHTVLLLEADLRHPELALELGLAKTTGLSNVLSGQLPLDKVIQRTAFEGLHTIGAGTVPLQPTELLSSKQTPLVLAALKERYSRIVVDATALQPLSDGALMGSLTDGVVVVVRHERVTRQMLALALDNLRAVDSRILGVALNALPDRFAEAHRRGAPRTRRAHRAETVDPGRVRGWPEPGEAARHDDGGSGPGREKDRGSGGSAADDPDGAALPPPRRG